MKYLLFAAPFCVISLAIKHPLPRFTVNLDLPPQQRWVKISEKYSIYGPAIRNEVHSWFPPMWEPLIMRTIDKLKSHIPEMYLQEMTGIAKGMNMTKLDVIAFNALSEILLRCTSIVAKDLDGNIIHGRNLDAIFTPSLWRALSVDVDFVKDGAVLYRGTTTVGRVGIVTGQRPGAYTFSVNQRISAMGDKWKTFIMVISGVGKMPSLLLRDMLKTATSFSEAVDVVSTAPLDVPGYLILGGTTPSEGVVITRGSLDTPDVFYLHNSTQRWFVLQTNYDRWLEPPKEDDRRHPAIKAMEAVGQRRISLDTMFDVLSTKPVFNNYTVFTTVMHASRPAHYQSYFQKL